QGHENAPDARFCRTCGTPVGGAPPPANGMSSVNRMGTPLVASGAAAPTPCGGAPPFPEAQSPFQDSPSFFQGSFQAAPAAFDDLPTALQDAPFKEPSARPAPDPDLTRLDHPAPTRLDNTWNPWGDAPAEPAMAAPWDIASPAPPPGGATTVLPPVPPDPGSGDRPRRKRLVWAAIAVAVLVV